MLYVVKKNILTISYGLPLNFGKITQCDKQKLHFLNFSEFSDSMNLMYGRIQSPDHILEDCVDRICGHFFNPEFHSRTLCTTM